MSRAEAIELVAKVIKAFQTEAFMECSIAEDCEADLQQALSLLQPLGKQPEPEAGEFTEDIRRWLKEDSLSYGNAVTKLIQACDRLDRQAQEKAEAVAARVEAENECCVLRGEKEKLREENLRFRKMEREIVHCPKCDKSYFTHELFDCPFCEEQALKDQE